MHQPNIFIDDNWRVRLADYGLSVNSDMTVIFSSTGRGSPRWMAPELLSPESPERPGFQRTKATDVYAFACTSWEVGICQMP
jgi:serine/threonine protein kinase